MGPFPNSMSEWMCVSFVQILHPTDSAVILAAKVAWALLPETGIFPQTAKSGHPTGLFTSTR